MDARLSGKSRLNLRSSRVRSSTRPSSPDACVQKLPGLVVKHQNFSRSPQEDRETKLEDEEIDETGDTEDVQRVPTFGITKAAKLPAEENSEIKYISPNSALLEAAKSNNPTECRAVLDSYPDLDPNCPNPGWTALHFAAHRGYLLVLEALLDYLDRLDLNCKTELLQTPLHLASLQNHGEIVKVLVRAGANLNVVDMDGSTPLHAAVARGFGDVVEWLVGRGSDLTISNLDGNTPADLATKDVLSRILAGLRRRESVDTAQPKKSRTMSTFAAIRYKPSPRDFQPLQILGRGSFGEVFLVQQRDTSRLYAMKVLPKDKLIHQNLIKYALAERNITECVKHPFIVGLKFAFQTEDRLFLILDYCPGGDLGWHLKREKRFSESRAKIFISEVILALEELHRRNVIFRDLKPDNVLLDGEGHAMLTDFGLSKVVSEDQISTSFCGSVAYLAPEILLRKGHGKAVDWYLLGILLYEMLVGIPPYYTPNHEQLFSNILTARLKLPHFLSPDAKSLLKQLLERNPVRRLGTTRDAEEIKEHRFFYGVDWEAVWRRELKPPLLPRPKMDLGTISEERAFGAVREQRVENGVVGWSFVGPSFTE